MKNIGERVARWIKLKGDTTPEAAKSLDITAPNLRKILIGTIIPTSHFLIKLNKTYNADINWILTGVSASKVYDEQEFFLSLNMSTLAYQAEILRLRKELSDLKKEFEKDE